MSFASESERVPWSAGFTPSFQELERLQTPSHLIVSSYLRKSRTFDLYARAFAALRAEAFYLPYELPHKVGRPDLAGLRHLLDHFRHNPRLLTLVISDPYKQLIRLSLDELTPGAEQAGAINLVYKRGSNLAGDNLDGEAFCLGVRHETGYDFTNRRMVFLGCGGVSSAVAAKLAPLVSEVMLIDIDLVKAEGLQQRLRFINRSLSLRVAERTGGMDLKDYEVFYNGTGMGKYSQDSASLDRTPLLEGDVLPTTGLAIDANYTPWETKFLRELRARSFGVLNGFSHMIGFVTLHLSFILNREVEYDLIKDLANHNS